MHPVTAILKRVVAVLENAGLQRVYRHTPQSLSEESSELAGFLIKQGAVSVINDLCTFDKLGYQLVVKITIADKGIDTVIVLDGINEFWLTVHKVLVPRGALSLDYVLEVVPLVASEPETDESKADKVANLELQFAVAFHANRDDPSVPDV